VANRYPNDEEWYSATVNRVTDIGTVIVTSVL
jgi:hypothetical protein